MLGLVTSKLSRMLSGLLAAIGILLGVYLYGKQTQKHEDKLDDLEDYKKIRERIDETPISVDINDAVDRLSKHNQLRD